VNLAARVEHAHLSAEAMHRAVDERNAQPQARRAEQVACGEIVGAVDDDVMSLQQPFDVRRADAFLDGDDFDARVERRERDARRLDLGHADARVGMHDLALQVRAFDAVVIDERDAPDAGRSEIERSRRAEPARADQRDARRAEFGLPFRTDFRQHEMARVAFGCVGAESAVFDGPSSLCQRAKPPRTEKLRA
jgi:hypothetical protein